MAPGPLLRLNISVRRNNLPEEPLFFAVPIDDNLTVAKLLERVNETIQLEDEENGWGLEDYVVERRAPQTGKCYGLVHYQDLRALENDDELVVRPLQSEDIKRRRLSGRHQITHDGARLVDGVPYGRPLLKRPRARPAFNISPRKRRRVGRVDEEEANQPLLLTEHGEDDSRLATPIEDEEEGLPDHPRWAKAEMDFEDTDDEEEDDHDFRPEDDDINDDMDTDISDDELADLQQDSRVHGEGSKNSAQIDASSSSEDDAAEEPIHATHVALRSAFPDASTKQIDRALRKKKGNARRAYRRLSKKHDAKMNLEDMLRFCDESDLALTLSKAVDNAEADLGEADNEHEEEQEQDEEDDVDDLTRYYDSHGFPPGSILGGTALNHMAAAMGKYTRLGSPAPEDNKKGDDDSEKEASAASSSSSDAGEEKSGEESNSSSEDEAAQDSDEDSDSGPEVESAKKNGAVQHDSVNDSETSSSGSSSEDEEVESESDSESESESDYDDEGAPLAEDAMDDESSEESSEEESSEEESEASTSDEDDADDDVESSSDSDSDDEPTSKGQPSSAPTEPESRPSQDQSSPPSESKTPVYVGIPGSGKLRTQKRNLRRRMQKLEQKAKAAAAAGLPDVEQQSRAEHELLARKKALLDELEAPSKDSPDAKSTPAEPSPEKLEAPSKESPDAKSTPAESSPEKNKPEAQALETSTSQAAPSPPKPRMRLDMSAGRRHIFSALGLRAPKTKADEAKISADLMKDVRPLTNARLLPGSVEANEASAAPDAQPVQDDNPDSWRDKITYTAVECCHEGVELSEPPFPFVQRWDPQQHGNRHGAGSKRGGKRKRKQRANEDFYDDGTSHDDKRLKHDESFDASWFQALDDRPAEDMDVELNYDDEPTEAAQQSQFTEKTQDTTVDDLPELPNDITSLPALLPIDAQAGMIITWRQLVLSKATNWQPEFVSLTAKISEVQDDGAALQVVLAQRDRDEKEFDQETGQRIYDRFEAPDVDEDGDDDDAADDGHRELAFTEMQEPRVLRQAPGSLISVNSEIAPTSPVAEGPASSFIPFSDPFEASLDPFEPTQENLVMEEPTAESTDLVMDSSLQERVLGTKPVANVDAKPSVDVEDADMSESDKSDEEIEEEGNTAGDDVEMSQVEVQVEDFTPIPGTAEPDSLASVPGVGFSTSNFVPETDSLVPETEYDQAEAAAVLPQLTSTTSGVSGGSAKSTTLTNGVSQAGTSDVAEHDKSDGPLDSPSRQLEEMSEAAMNASSHASRDVSNQPDVPMCDDDVFDDSVVPESPKVVYPTLPVQPSSPGSLRSGRQVDPADLGNGSFSIFDDDDVVSGTPKRSSEHGEDEKTPTQEGVKPSPAKSTTSDSSISSLGQLWATAQTSRNTQSTQSSTKAPTMAPWKARKMKIEDEKDKEYKATMAKLDEDAGDFDGSDQLTPIKKTSSPLIKQSSTQLSSPDIRTIKSLKKSVSPPLLPKKRRVTKAESGFKIPAGSQVISLLSSDPEDVGGLPSGPGWVAKKGPRGVSVPAASQGRNGAGAGGKFRAASQGIGAKNKKLSRRW